MEEIQRAQQKEAPAPDFMYQLASTLELSSGPVHPMAQATLASRRPLC